jgi:hypothetical protein
MATRRNHGAQGNLNLRYEFNESVLGARDSLGSADLSGSDDGAGVIMRVVNNSFHQLSGHATTDVRVYELDAAELERLVIKHGTRVN